MSDVEKPARLLKNDRSTTQPGDRAEAGRGPSQSACREALRGTSRPHRWLSAGKAPSPVLGPSGRSQDDKGTSLVEKFEY